DHLAPPSALLVVGDSRGARSTDVEDDGVASRAAASRQAVSGTVVHNGARFAEAAAPVPGTDSVLLVSAPLHEALASVRFVRERLALAGAIALASALALGYVGAWLFARRLRRSGLLLAGSTSRCVTLRRTRSGSSRGRSTVCGSGCRRSTTRGASSSR